MRLLEEATGFYPWDYGSHIVKQELMMNERVEVPEQDSWRVVYLAKLLEQRQFYDYQGNDEEVQILSRLIDSLCTN